MEIDLCETKISNRFCLKSMQHVRRAHFARPKPVQQLAGFLRRHRSRMPAAFRFETPNLAPKDLVNSLCQPEPQLHFLFDLFELPRIENSSPAHQLCGGNGVETLRIKTPGILVRTPS